jgi:hypothetical protein
MKDGEDCKSAYILVRKLGSNGFVALSELSYFYMVWFLVLDS